MIDFKPKWKRSGYCLRLKGNGIEEELIAITSWGQDRKSSLVIVSATVDGGVVVLHSSNKRIILASALTVIDNTIRRWSHGGVKPSKEQRAELDAKRAKVLEQLANMWG
jgi:hypothetical protein